MKTKSVAILILAFIISCATAQTTKTENTKANTASPVANSAENTAPPVKNQQARVPGVLYSESQDLSGSVTAPASVKAGADFQVTVTTSGNGCVSAADEGVILADASADVFVYDFTTATRPGTICTMIFKQLQHKVTLRFAAKGEAVIRVWGRRQGGTSQTGEPVVVEKRVKVV